MRVSLRCRECEVVSVRSPLCYTVRGKEARKGNDPTLRRKKKKKKKKKKKLLLFPPPPLSLCYF